MPRTTSIAVQNNFIKGLITEATALTFPENACTDVSNCVFDLTGKVSRRHGFDFEDSFANNAVGVAGDAIVTFLWKNAGGDGDVSFVVTQIGDTLYFYKTAGTSLSAGIDATTVALSSFFPVGITTVRTQECQFTSGNGVLFVTHPQLNQFAVNYNTGTDTLSTTAITLQIRDFDGDSADTNAVDTRPTATVATLSNSHHYNLLNQGWTSTNLNAWDTARADMPSNADVSWYFKNSSNAFDFTIVDNTFVGNSPAPKGHFLYNVYSIQRSNNQTGATDLITTTDRVSTSAFFAGRVFYSGLKTPDFNSKIFFTQIIQNSSQYGACYQINDPTSEQLFDLLASDGGVIDIVEAGTIIKLLPVLNALIVWATNGIWMITGSTGSGFAANDYSVIKLSSVTNVSATSFIDAQGIPYWWNFDGIYTINKDPQTNNLTVSSLTDTTIKTYYDNIPLESKQYSRGIHDPFNKRIQWVFRSTDASSIDDRYTYDGVLNLDLRTGAFYPFSISQTNVKIHSVVNLIGFGGLVTIDNVADGANNVIDGTNNVIAQVTSSTAINSKVKFLCSYTNAGTVNVTFAEEKSLIEQYRDWVTFDTIGVSYSSFFTTGYVVRGQGALRFQQNYVYVYSKRTISGSYMIRGIWDFGSRGDSGRWTTQQAVASGNFDYVVNRVKIRGNGLACQLKFENDADSPFNIVGWSVFNTSNKWV